MPLEIFHADYSNTEHALAVVRLLDGYAQDPMGGESALSEFTRDNLISALSETPGAFSVLGTVDGEFIALANCFRSFSTFACQPLINIHDLYVSADARGKGVGQAMLSYVESEARAQRCCKVTLEVLEGNKVAFNAYKKFGFVPYSLDEKTGHALLLQKSVSSAA